MTETTWVSFWTLSMCLPLKTLSKTLAFFPFWLLVTAPLSTTSFWTLKFRVLFIWSILSSTAVFNCELFGFVFRAVSWSYKANIVWSWTESCNFDLYNPSRITSEGNSPADNRAKSHPASKSWTSLLCKLFLNNFESPCTASRLHGNAFWSCKQFVFLARIGRVLEHAPLRHPFAKVNVLVEKTVQCRRNCHIKHIEVGETSAPYIRSRCHKFVIWPRYLNFLWSSALWDEDTLFSNKLQSWSWYSSFEIPQSHEFFPDAIPKIGNLGLTIIPLWDKFHQYDSTFHLYIGSVVRGLTFSTVLFSFHSPVSL